MGSMSMVHWLIVAAVALLLFGRGRISETMGDFGKGIRSFRQGLADDEADQSRKLEDYSARKNDRASPDRETQKPD